MWRKEAVQSPWEKQKQKLKARLIPGCRELSGKCIKKKSRGQKKQEAADHVRDSVPGTKRDK